jgi:glucose-6-phosphate isomerase, archaeal
MTSIDTGLDLHATRDPLGWRFGPGVFGPKPELRALDAMRKSLLDPRCSGPDVVYAIAMDIGRHEDRKDLEERHLLFGAVTYAAGRLGCEPIRSQGHVHARSPRNGWSTPEVYEIWAGRAVVLMQESAGDDPGRCFAVEGGPGDVIIVPPGWAHATISADPASPLAFGAWCDRAYGFDYAGVRAHGGLAWFPILEDSPHGSANLKWVRNRKYLVERPLTIKRPRLYREFDVEPGAPIYSQYRSHPRRFGFVPDPQEHASAFVDFVP